MYQTGGVMPEIQSFQDYAEHCFELAKSSDFLEKDIALEAFELLTANDYDRISAHALGVSL
jgi:CMP-N-acetylneuraminic acid synthetase